MLEYVTRCLRMLDDLDILFAWGLQWRWNSSMVGGFWPDWGGLPSSRCGGLDVNGDKTCQCQCPGRMLRFRSMFQEKLGEFGHGGVTWLILVFQDFLPFIFCSKDRRLNAKGYVRFSSHRHAATCIQAQAFGPLSLLFILGLEVLPFKVWLPHYFFGSIPRATSCRIMKIPFAPQVGARCWGRWCYRLVVSIWTGSARGLWPKSAQHASKQWWSPLGLIKENGMNLISEESFESSKTIQFSKISIVAELILKSFPQATDSMPWLRSFCPLAGEVWGSRGLDAVPWLSQFSNTCQP